MASLPQAVRKCGREQRGHPRRLAYPSDFSQWVALVAVTKVDRRIILNLAQSANIQQVRNFTDDGYDFRLEW